MLNLFLSHYLGAFGQIIIPYISLIVLCGSRRNWTWHELKARLCILTRVEQPEFFFHFLILYHILHMLYSLKWQVFPIPCCLNKVRRCSHLELLALVIISDSLVHVVWLMDVVLLVLRRVTTAINIQSEEIQISQISNLFALGSDYSKRDGWFAHFLLRLI